MSFNRRMVGPGLARRPGARGNIGPSGASGPITPKTRFGSKVAEWWRADLDVSDGGGGAGVADSWTGQERGIVLAAPAEGNRCVLNAADANFGGQPTVEGSRVGTNFLRATGISPALVTTAQSPCILVVGRMAAAHAGVSEVVLQLTGATTTALWIFMSGAAAMSGRVTVTGPANLNYAVTTDPETPALMRLEAAPVVANGHKFYHNEDLAQGTSAAHFAEDISAVYFGVTSAGTSHANAVAAEIVILNALPSAGEMTAYAGDVLDRYGVTA